MYNYCDGVMDLIIKIINCYYMKSLRSVSSPLSSDSELDEVCASFLDGVDRLLSSVILLEPAVLRGEEWLTVPLSDFLTGVETTCRACII